MKVGDIAVSVLVMTVNEPPYAAMQGIITGNRYISNLWPATNWEPEVLEYGIDLI